MFSNGHTNKCDFVPEAVRKFAQMGDTLDTRPTPSRPKLHDIDFAFLQLGNFATLNPLGDSKFRGLIPGLNQVGRIG